ncbi:MAG: polysaccharide deacetylase family protein [Balneolaceae bacterium]
MNPDIIRSYILETFASIYQIPTSIKITYGDESEGDIVIKKGNVSFFNHSQSLPEDFAWHTWRDQLLPFPLDSEENQGIITASGNQVHINYDIFAASFYFLSSWQEIHQTETDSYGRFSYKSSFQYKYDLMLLPVVNYYFDILKTAIERHTGSALSRKNSEASFTAFLSHDIDQIHSGWKEDSKFELKRGNLLEAASILSNRITSEQDEWNNLDVIVELEKMLGVVSTFFFLAKKSEVDADYLIKDVEGYFDMIEEAGSEIGVHGSIGSGFDGKKLKEEINSIGRNIFGNRFHYLQNNVKITPQILDEAELHYDSSLCFDDYIGFRNGFCFPFRPFNFATRKAYKHLQIPLLVMDSTLKFEEFMGHQSYPEVKEQVDQIIGEVEKFGGVFTLLWHNTFFTDHMYAGWGPRYIQIVQELKNKGAEFVTGSVLTERIRKLRLVEA